MIRYSHAMTCLMAYHNKKRTEAISIVLQATIDSQDTFSFSVVSGVRSMNEVFPLDRASEAYDLMMSGKARFRAVLTTGH
jgi:D-arabinose 1-dehydrogenase-like Zn-dependent alcohol dehydrogenase